MAKRKRRRSTLSRAIISLVFGVPTLWSLTKKVGAVVGYEARLAGQSVVSILMLALLCVILLTTIWLCLLAMLFVYLVSLHWSTLIVLLVLLGVNLIMLMILCMLLSKYKKRLSFPETRYLLEEARSIYEEL